MVKVVSGFVTRASAGSGAVAIAKAAAARRQNVRNREFIFLLLELVPISAELFSSGVFRLFNQHIELRAEGGDVLIGHRRDVDRRRVVGFQRTHA